MGKAQQFFTAFACSFGSLIMGLINTWPSYTLSQLTHENTTVLSVPMTDFQGSMAGSLPSLGAMVGTAIAGPLIDKIGRQKGGLLISLPYVLSWAIIGQTSSALVILVARFLSGTPGGAFLVYAPIFISEVAEDSIRGALASGPVTFYCLGSLISYLMGWFLSYRVIVWSNLACSVLCAAFCLMVTESPLYLMRQNREEDAKTALSRYRSASTSSKVVLEELSRLKAQITPAVELVSVTDDSNQKSDEANKEKTEPEKELLYERPDSSSVEQKMSSFKLLLVSPSSRRAFTVVGTSLSLQVLMGMMPVTVYAQTLFAQAVPNLSANFCSVLLAVVLVSGCTVTALVADKAGRRVLIITSSVMVGVMMLALGIQLQTSILPGWMSAVVILLYCFSFNIGAGTVPYVLLAEAFIPEVQGFASMLLVEWVWFLNFVIIGIFPISTKLLGIHGVFYVFAAIAFVNTALSFFNVPETKGLSNDQIQEIFLKRRRK